VPEAAILRHPAAETEAEPRPAYDLIELLFFAYRDFVGDPDRVLDQYGFGRAHHRVLHFVARRPGLSIADLLEVLRITKQSLNRVLKELVDKGFVELRPGTADRRQRLLFPTGTGRDLAGRLARRQSHRIARALEADPSGQTEAAAKRFLQGLIEPADRSRIRAILAGPAEP